MVALSIKPEPSSADTMFSKVLLCCVLAIAAAQQPPADGPPQPYTFSYDNTDEFGTRISQQETGDENNNKVGSYSYTDANGLTRTVKYTADADGFHVVVETNEPGTKTSNPADAQYISNAADVAPAPAPVAVKPAPVVVKATPVPPQPYSFSYDNTDEFGTRISQQETGDENNNKVGSYSYVDPNGVTRTVKYTADADGFHVVVETNEPGTKSSNPADAQYIANPIEVAPAPAAAVVAKPVEVKVAAVKPVVVQAATPVVHAAPFTVNAAPIAYATAQHVTPILAHAPLTYTLGRAKSA
ncbi:hypothetical protein V5799_003536 [Amblyomma americanum]|uniref:Cuticle protein n=1 Tax=Amblyomma americanum TaxID=6943 RepID=A0AAQ4D8N9_AMBAM